jgi:hypothetical protein
MPTKHARIAIVRDPEVEAALKAAAPVLGRSKPDAAIARELVIRGAKAVLDDPGSELDRWLNERGGVIRAKMSPREAYARARELAKEIPPGGRPMSEILDELRADRV